MGSSTGRICEWMIELDSQTEPLDAVKPDWLTVSLFSLTKQFHSAFIVFLGGRWEHRGLGATNSEQVKPRFSSRLKK